jgi:nucleoside-diphosphate-sugar epimerase
VRQNCKTCLALSLGKTYILIDSTSFYEAPSRNNNPKVTKMSKTANLSQPPNEQQEGPLSVVIIGGLGCIGLAITSCFSRRHPDAQIHVVDLEIPDADSDDRFLECVKEYHRCDITETESLYWKFRFIKPRVVIHTAALIPSAVKRLGFDNKVLEMVNVGGTKNVVMATRALDAEVLVYTSSTDVVKTSSWKNFANVSEKKDDIKGYTKWDQKYPETKVRVDLNPNAIVFNF